MSKEMEMLKETWIYTWVSMLRFASQNWFINVSDKCVKGKKGARVERSRGERKEREREKCEWWLFFNLCDYFFSFVLAAILCHNYSTQENSYLIIYSCDKVLLLKYAPLSAITQTLQFAKIER